MQTAHGPGNGAAAGGSLGGGRGGQVSRAGLHWSMALLMMLATWFYSQVRSEAWQTVPLVDVASRQAEQLQLLKAGPQSPSLPLPPPHLQDFSSVQRKLVFTSLFPVTWAWLTTAALQWRPRWALQLYCACWCLVGWIAAHRFCP